MEEVLSLGNACVLTILSEIHNYSAGVLSLLPPRLRARILLHLPAVDLYRLSQNESPWVGVPFSSDDVWRTRFETTLEKHSNVACLDEVARGESSWLDIYLLSCLINIPVYYETRANHPPFGAAFFVTSDVVLRNFGIVKLKCGSFCHGFVFLKARNKQGPSSHMVSKHYQETLITTPFNLPVGVELSMHNRIKTILSIFPGWKPSMVPLEFDDLSEFTGYNEPLCKSFLSNVKTVQLLSKHLRLCPHAEINHLAIDVAHAQTSIGQFCNYVINLLKHGKTNRLILLPPAMKKEVVWQQSNGDQEDESITLLTPLSMSTSKLLEWFFQHFPNASEVFVHMHDGHQDSGLLDVLRGAKLANVQLNVLRPTFSQVIPLSLPFMTIGTISLNGLAISSCDFCSLLLSVLNSPNEQKLKLSNISVTHSDDTIEIDPQVMKDSCRYKTSLHFHRVKANGCSLIESVLAAYDEIWLNDLLVYLIHSAPPFPKSTVINCKSFHLERFVLSPENLQVLSPILHRAQNICLNVGESDIGTADFSISEICRIIEVCGDNLSNLECKQSYPYSGLSTVHLDQFFSAVFSLPDSCLANLTFNPSRLINSYSSTTTGRAILLHPVHQLKKRTEVEELKKRMACYRLLCDIWKRQNRRVKVKCLSGISGVVLNEMEDELLDIFDNLHM